MLKVCLLSYLSVVYVHLFLFVCLFNNGCVIWKSLMVAKAKEELEQEMEEKEAQKEKYLEEKAPPIQISCMSIAELQVP